MPCNMEVYRISTMCEEFVMQYRKRDESKLRDIVNAIVPYINDKSVH